MRLSPILTNQNKTIYFIAADRVGDEEGTSYMGGSCIL